MDQEILLRVKFRERLEFIKFIHAELKFEQFLQKVFDHFGIQESVKFKVKILDSIKTVIDHRYLREVIEMFRSQEHFFVEVVYEVDFDKTDKMVTPFIIREFLIKQNKDWILGEYDRTQNLSEYGRKQLVPELCAFMRTFFAGNVKKIEKIMTINAALAIFPNMRAQNGPEEGILLGYIDNRFKYEEKLLRKPEEGKDPPNSNAEGNNNCPNVVGEIDALIESMKTIVITDASMPDIKQHLKTTRGFRDELLTDKKIDLLEMFPYFFVKPELILFEFSDRFTDCNNLGFHEKWNNFAYGLNAILNSQYDSSMFFTNWPQDIENILILLKLFPTSKTGKNGLAKRDTFYNASEKLIVFFETGTPPSEMTRSANKFPYMVAYGPTKNSIEQFHVVLEKHLIPMPQGFDIGLTFDVFFKLHKIFNLNFEPNIKNAMNFVQHFVYGFKERGVKMTTRMEDVHNRVLRTINNEQSNTVQ